MIPIRCPEEGCEGVVRREEEAMTARKLAEADAQIQTLRRHVAEECVAITSSIDTIPPAMVPREMRDRWLRALRQRCAQRVHDQSRPI